MLSAVVGINWGDEGKGRIVDYLAPKYDVVSRYQGGNNAGHTVVNDKGKFILNLLPSGILQDGTVNVLGTGMVIDINTLSMKSASCVRAESRFLPKISKSATVQRFVCRITACRIALRRTDFQIKSSVQQDEV